MLINSRRAELLRSTCEDFVETYRRAVCFSVEELSNTADASQQMVQTGLSNYAATNVLNIVTGGGVPAPFNAGTTVTGSGPNRILPGSIFLALMTAVDQDTGTGGLEVGTAGNSGYTRVQVAGTATPSAVSGTNSSTLTFTATPTWVQNGMFVQNILPVGTASTGTASIALGTTVTGTTSTTVTISGSMTGSVGVGDVIQFTAFQLATQTGTAQVTNPSGEAPAQVSNNSIITFPQATGGTAPGFGTVMAFELRDGSTGGNLLLWDFLGNFLWQPTTIASGTGQVFTAHAHGFSAGQAVIFSTEYGGTTPPSFTTSNLNTSGSAVLVVSGTSGPATDTFAITNGGTNVTPSASGNGMFRAVTQQSIPAGVTASFAVGALVATAA